MSSYRRPKRPVRFERGTDAASIVLPDTPDVRALRAEQLWEQEYRRQGKVGE